ncbi:nucleoside triphosphate pyrophosphohydrolase [Thermanaerovibrio acidaminovorans]|uniref:nucleoside triphosphate pyrophosphohydrolase n=1 Tax=Thermanaerovibrio acidaminovorans TaxID=81462 RepID=UPI002491EBDF|nr:nucleoside triphosphate pyrophosphohydrolase [Thermanaerovibrio acidaminovorans]
MSSSLGCKVEKLVSIMERLRSPGGCPWDREQTLGSLRRYIIEEAFELVEAIDQMDLGAIREEAGDLLLQVVFISQIAKEQGDFNLGDVVDGLVNKLIHRHPHVFGDVEVSSAEEVSRNWEAIKSRKRIQEDRDGSAMAGIPRGLPALLRALRIQERAAKVGFDWGPGDQGPVLDKISEEVQEVLEALSSGEVDRMRDEVGDLLFAVVNLARRTGIDPEEALRGSCDKFDRRFRAMEGMISSPGAMLDMSLEELDSLWERAKESEGR